MTGIHLTPYGVPYIDDDTELYVYPSYTRQLADKLQEVGEPTAAVLALLADAEAAQTAAQAAQAAAEAARDAALAGAFTARRCRGIRSDSFSIPDATFTRITGYTEQYDTGPGAGGMLANATGLVTIPEAGGYRVDAGFAFYANATGRKFLMIEKGSAAAGSNVSLIRHEFANTPSGYPSASVSFEQQFAAGDVLSLCAYQTSGAGLNIRGDVWPAYFAVRRVW